MENIFKKKKENKKIKDKTCVIHYEANLYSEVANVEIFTRSGMDLEIGILGILVAYLNRGHSVEDIKEIINKLEGKIQ